MRFESQELSITETSLSCYFSKRLKRYARRFRPPPHEDTCWYLGSLLERRHRLLLMLWRRLSSLLLLLFGLLLLLLLLLLLFSLLENDVCMLANFGRLLWEQDLSIIVVWNWTGVLGPAARWRPRSISNHQ